METVTISRKFQVVIPKRARESMDLESGQKLVPIVKGNSLVFVRIGKLKDAVGLAKGIDTSNIRDHNERSY